MITMLCNRRMRSALSATLCEGVGTVRTSFWEEVIFAAPKKEEHVRQREQQMPRHEVIKGAGNSRRNVNN